MCEQQYPVCSELGMLRNSGRCFWWLTLVSAAYGGPLRRGQGDWTGSLTGHRVDGRSLSWSGPQFPQEAKETVTLSS